MKKILALVAIAAASTTAFAQTTTTRGNVNDGPLLYGELGYTQFMYEDDDIPDFSPDLDAVSGVIGYKFHPNVSGELYLATGTGSDRGTFAGVPFSAKLDHSYGLFLRPSAMVTNQLEVFGRAGFQRTKVSLRAGGISDSDSSSSWAYGVGANYYFANNLYGQLAYTSLYNRDDVQVDGITLGLGMRF